MAIGVRETACGDKPAGGGGDYLCGGFGGCWGGGGAEIADDAGGIPDGGEGSPGFRAAEAEDVAVHFRKEVADGTELRAQGDCQGTAARNGGHDDLGECGGRGDYRN